MKIEQKVIDAAYRILDTENNSYPGLVLSGSEESAKKFHDDVMAVAEFVGEVTVYLINHGQLENLYEIAKQVCHEQGMPWTDPRTGITYEPPKVS